MQRSSTDPLLDPAASVYHLFPIIYGELPTELSDILGPKQAVWVVSLLTAKIIPRGLTPEIVPVVFGVW